MTGKPLLYASSIIHYHPHPYPSLIQHPVNHHREQAHSVEAEMWISAMYGTLYKCTDMSPAFSASQSLSLMDTVIRGMLTRVRCLKTTLLVACQSVLSICVQEESSKT